MSGGNLVSPHLRRGIRTPCDACLGYHWSDTGQLVVWPASSNALRYPAIPCGRHLPRRHTSQRMTPTTPVLFASVEEGRSLRSGDAHPDRHHDGFRPRRMWHQPLQQDHDGTDDSERSSCRGSGNCSACVVNASSARGPTPRMVLHPTAELSGSQRLRYPRRPTTKFRRCD